ncbi:MAG TPA: HEAT repeat domain-containing protein [Terriglobales bacterium]|nr:HEAT repeat domain-containing protein [Terriglobales bacterium]
MRRTHGTGRKKMSRMMARAAAGCAMALLLGAALVAPPAAGSPAAQQMEQAKSSMALTYDSLDAILRDLATYKFDEGVGAPLALRAYVFAHKDDPAARKEVEAKLLAFVKAAPAPGGLMAACRSLSLVGGDASAPVLGDLLLDPETTDPARYALERIPGEAADRVLLGALDKAQGDVKRGIISTIGGRGAASAGAVAALQKLAEGKDATFAPDAVRALGRIGSDGAVRVLLSVVGRDKGAAKAEAASGLLACAAAALKAGRVEEVTALTEKLLRADLPAVDRQAAYRMRLAADNKDAQGPILNALSGKGKDPVLVAPAISVIPQAFGGSEIGQVLPLMAKLPEAAQVQLMAVLASYPAEAVLPAVLSAVTGPLAAVRMEAMRTIGKVGNASAVSTLALRAAKAAGDEQALARETLARLRGTDVDNAVVNQLKTESDETVKAELVTAVGARRIAAGKPVLMGLVKGGTPALRLKAVAALKDVATPADMRDLLALLFAIDDETAREAMRDTVAGVALAIPRPLARGDAAESLLAAEKDPRRKADLLRILGKIGDDTALPLVRRALADPDKDVVDAAARALADWPTATARDDVYAVAASSANLTHKVLALRAYVRMIGLEPYRRPDGAAGDLEKALALATRPEEKKLVLGLLPRFPCDRGLKLAESLEGDAAVAAEAKAAADRIRASTARK